MLQEANSVPSMQSDHKYFKCRDHWLAHCQVKEAKGLDMVRRDWCGLAKDMLRRNWCGLANAAEASMVPLMQ